MMEMQMGGNGMKWDMDQTKIKTRHTLEIPLGSYKEISLSCHNDKKIKREIWIKRDIKIIKRSLHFILGELFIF